MAQALRLAQKGLWSTDPNPRVGCVLARNDKVVGQGWHERAGEPHAEVIALRDAGERARSATAYVTLEPCSHHGRTPPCAEALIGAGVARVVCAVGDPHPEVDGGGLAALRSAGIEVETGLMATQARALNPGFFSRFERHRPWVRAKLAASLDGRVVGPDGRSRWITGMAARRDGHRWRARSGAILTGIGTVLADDPALDVRIEGAERQPVVIIADSQGRLPQSARLLRTGAPVWQACSVGAASRAENVKRIEIASDPEAGLDLVDLLARLAALEINELHVEAGPTLTGALLAGGLVDELLLYQASSLVGADGAAMVRLPGIDSLAAKLEWVEVERRRIGADWRVRLRPLNAAEPIP